MNSNFAQTYLSEILKELTYTTDTLSCNKLSNIWYNIINNSICNDGIKGLFIIWISHIFLAWSLAISTFLASLIYQFFESEYWNISKDTLINDEGITEDNAHETALIIFSEEIAKNEIKKKDKLIEILKVYGNTDDI